MDYKGYAGNILHVDLSTSGIRKEPLEASPAREAIGGPEAGARLLLTTLKPNIDPLSPENVLVFGTGPLIGTLFPGSGKCYLSTKYSMPASSDGNKCFISHSMFGGNSFGIMMKNAGYDHIVVTGRAKKPCYLKVTDEDVEICDACDIWGKDIYGAGRILRENIQGKNVSCGTWVIGQAGENLVRPSLGWADDWHNAGRSAGAVAGSKNLKAVVTLGSKGIKIANIKRFTKLVNESRQLIKDEIAKDPLGMHPWSPELEKLLEETKIGSRILCSGGYIQPFCHICRHVYEVKDGPHKGIKFGGSPAGFIQSFHEGFKLSDRYEAYKILHVMNGYGLDFITVGPMINLVTKLYKRGILSMENMGGLELDIDNPDYYITLCEKIVNRQDIGAYMADGWYRLCERLSIDPENDPETDCPISKGTNFIVDARLSPGFFRENIEKSTIRGTGLSPDMGLASLVHPKTRQTHNESTYFPQPLVQFDDVISDAQRRIGLTKKEMARVFTAANYFNTGRMAMYSERAQYTYDALGICDTPCSPDLLSEVYSAATGFEILPQELIRAAERASALEKLLNFREGFTRKDDIIPAVYLQNMQIPIKAGDGDRYLTDWFGNRLTREDIEEMIDNYYEEKGWDARNGLPTKKKLIELGLEEYVGILKEV